MNYREELGFNYPDRCDEHMLQVKHVRDIKFDGTYDYYDDSKIFKFRQFWLFFAIRLIVFPLMNLSHGLKIHGKENIKKNKVKFKDGAITIANHVFMWDYLAVLKAIHPHIPSFPGWATNFEGPNGPLIRTIGGIPIPTDDFRGLVKFKKTMDQLFTNKHWIHFYPEGSMWYYYPDIRPFKPAIFQFAVTHNKPIIPIGFSFRKRRGLLKLFWNMPCVNMHIGEPLYPKQDLSYEEAVDELHLRSYIAVQNLVGIHKGDPTYNEDQNLDNYKKTM